MKKTKIEIEIFVHQKPEKTWEYWTDPKHIVHWYFASDDWCSPRAENDLTVQGRFKTRMEARDGSFGFDLTGTYIEILPFEKIVYILDDDRQVEIFFSWTGTATKITEVFEAESVNSLDRQKTGWKSILENFKKYAENIKE